MSDPCQVCSRDAEDQCVRCEQPTCDEHFFEQEHLGLCNPCREALDALVAEGNALTGWPYPLRRPVDDPNQLQIRNVN